MNEFFVNAKKNKPEWREEQMEVIKKVRGPVLGWEPPSPDSQSQVAPVFQDYYKALEDADEKVQLANQIYDLVSCLSTSRCFTHSSPVLICFGGADEP